MRTNFVNMREGSLSNQIESLNLYLVNIRAAEAYVNFQLSKDLINLSETSPNLIFSINDIHIRIKADKTNSHRRYNSNRFDVFVYNPAILKCLKIYSGTSINFQDTWKPYMRDSAKIFLHQGDHLRFNELMQNHKHLILDCWQEWGEEFKIFADKNGLKDWDCVSDLWNFNGYDYTDVRLPWYVCGCCKMPKRYSYLSQGLKCKLCHHPITRYL